MQNSLPSGVVHDDEVSRIVGVFESLPALHGRPELREIRDLCLNDFDPTIHRQCVVAIGRIDGTRFGAPFGGEPIASAADRRDPQMGSRRSRRRKLRPQLRRIAANSVLA
jgi:hypothetical protein